MTAEVVKTLKTIMHDIASNQALTPEQRVLSLIAITESVNSLDPSLLTVNEHHDISIYIARCQQFIVPR